MFIVTWLFDKLGYMPKISVDTTWPFPATAKTYIPHPDEQPITKPVAKKPATRKPKASVAAKTARNKKVK